MRNHLLRTNLDTFLPLSNVRVKTTPNTEGTDLQFEGTCAGSPEIITLQLQKEVIDRDDSEHLFVCSEDPTLKIEVVTKRSKDMMIVYRIQEEKTEQRLNRTWKIAATCDMYVYPCKTNPVLLHARRVVNRRSLEDFGNLATESMAKALDLLNLKHLIKLTRILNKRWTYSWMDLADGRGVFLRYGFANHARTDSIILEWNFQNPVDSSEFVTSLIYSAIDEDEITHNCKYMNLSVIQDDAHPSVYITDYSYRSAEDVTARAVHVYVRSGDDNDDEYHHVRALELNILPEELKVTVKDYVEKSGIFAE